MSAPVSASLFHRVGSYYNGDYHGWSLTVAMRAGARLLSEVVWNRDDITLPGGQFRNDLVPVKVSYAFTSLAGVQGLLHYNRQASTFIQHPLGSAQPQQAFSSSTTTGCDTSSFSPDELLGRSFVVKYTRLFSY